MDNKLFKYTDFLNESKIDLILESNMEYTNDFIQVISLIDNKIAEFILSINNNEVDVNTNFIDIDLKNPDFIKYKPDDKVKSQAIVRLVGFANNKFSEILLTSNRIPVYGQVGTFEEITPSQIEILEKSLKINEYGINSVGKFYSDYIINYVVFKWRDNEGESSHVFNRDGLSIGKEFVKKIEFKVGKFVSRLLKKTGFEFNDQDLEDFVNKYKASVKKFNDTIFDNLELVSGVDIKKWYLEDNYGCKDGTLGNSCMRYYNCQDYLDIYVDNEDYVSLLILKDGSGEKIKARALVWKLDDFCEESSVIFMDRVYTNDSSDVQIFIEYAKKLNWAYKEIQNSSSDGNYILEDDIFYGSLALSMNSQSEYDKYPYMDTLKYYTPHSGELRSDYGEFTLEETDGTTNICDICNGSSEVTCYNCDGDGQERCDACDNGSVRCGTCDDGGDGGSIDCSSCDGSGELECEDCGGDGTECENCNYSGKLTCGDCDGDGSIECSDCDGSGYIECSDCDGSGESTCSSCDGDGNVECGAC